jgi:hypothetical protein
MNPGKNIYAVLNDAPGNQNQRDTDKSLLTEGQWESLSPEPASAGNRETAETLTLTRKVDGSVDKERSGESTGADLKKHRPVNRRFSSIHQPHLYQDENLLAERLEGVEEHPSNQTESEMQKKKTDGSKEDKEKEEEESDDEEEESDEEEEVKLQDKETLRKKQEKAKKGRKKLLQRELKEATLESTRKAHIKQMPKKEENKKAEDKQTKKKKEKKVDSESDSSDNSDNEKDDREKKSESENKARNKRKTHRKESKKAGDKQPKKTKKKKVDSENESSSDSDSEEEGDYPDLEQESDTTDDSDTSSEEDTEDSDEEPDDDDWDNIISMVSGNGDIEEALTLTIMGNEARGKNTTASEIVSGILNWKTHETAFTQVRKNNALTTEHAKDFLVKSLSGETSPLHALRATARYKGNAVNKAGKKALKWIMRHALKTSSAASIVIDSVNKKDEDCESFELKADQAIEYFCRTKKSDWATYLARTSRGETRKIKDKPLEKEPGTQMLNQDHDDCEKAWAILLIGVINVLSHTSDTQANWQQTYANWLTVGRVMTVGITEIKGAFPRQKAHEEVDDVVARMTKQEDKNKTAMKLAHMSGDIPQGSALVGNLVEAVNYKYVEDMREKIRDGVTRKKGIKAYTLGRVTKMLNDAESRLRAKVFGQAGDSSRQRDRDNNNKGRNKGKGGGERNDGRRSDGKGRDKKPKTYQRSLTPEQIQAITNYAKTEGKEWKEVKLEDIEATQLGVKGWAEKTPPDTTKPEHDKDGSKEDKGKERKKRACTFYARGACTRGDQCTFLHEDKDKPVVNHQEEKEESSDEDDEDMYESYHIGVDSAPEEESDDECYQDTDEDYEPNGWPVSDWETDTESEGDEPETQRSNGYTHDPQPGQGQNCQSTPPSNHTSTSPRLGSRHRMCKCSTGIGSHGCRTELEEGEKDICHDCEERACECDECEGNCTGQSKRQRESQEWEPTNLTQQKQEENSDDEDESEEDSLDEHTSQDEISDMWWIQEENITEEVRHRSPSKIKKIKQEDKPEDDTNSDLTDEEYFKAVEDQNLSDAEIKSASGEEEEEEERQIAQMERTEEHYRSTEKGPANTTQMRQMTISEQIQALRATNTTAAATRTDHTAETRKSQMHRNTATIRNSQVEVSIMENAEVSEEDAVEWASMTSIRRAIETLRTNKENNKTEKCKCKSCDKEATTCKATIDEVFRTILRNTCQDCSGQTCKCKCAGCQEERDDEEDPSKEMQQMHIDDDAPEDIDIDFDMTKSEERTTEKTQYKSKQRRMEKIRERMHQENLKEDFDIPAEYTIRQRMKKQIQKKMRRRENSWTENRRITTIEHLQDKIMTASWEPVSDDSRYECERETSPETRRLQAKELHTTLVRAEQQQRIKASKELHEALNAAENDINDQPEKQKTARDLHKILREAESQGEKITSDFH